MVRRSVLIKGFVILAAVLPFFAAVFFLRPSTGVDLGNGWSVQLLTIQADQLVYHSDNTVRSVFRDLGPTSITQRMSQPIEYRKTAAENQGTIFFLFRVTSNSSKRTPETSPWSPIFEVIDSNGFVYNEWSKTEIPTHTRQPGFTALFSSQVFPRRDPQLRFRWKDPVTQENLWELTTQNPAFRPKFDEWTPGPVPSTCHLPTKSLTVERVTIDPVTGQISAVFNPPFREIRGMEYPWVPRFFDVTGNRSNRLSPFEPVWRIVVDHSRQANDLFLPEEIIRIDCPSWPVQQSIRPLTESRTYGELTITPRYLLGPGIYRYQHGRLTSEGSFVDDGFMDAMRIVDSTPEAACFELRTSKPGVLIEHSRVMISSPFFVTCRDTQGRELLPSHIALSQLNTASQSFFWAAIEQVDEMTSACTFEVKIPHRSQQFEFFVKPPAGGPIPP